MKSKVRLVIADVDGTLVTKEKILTHARLHRSSDFRQRVSPSPLPADGPRLRAGSRWSRRLQIRRSKERSEEKFSLPANVLIGCSEAREAQPARLGLPRTTLIYKVKRLGIAPLQTLGRSEATPTRDGSLDVNWKEGSV